MNKYVQTKNLIEGFHCYPNAPEEVRFLSYRHRHVFQVTCKFKVTELDREKEIFIYREKIFKFFKGFYGYPCEFGASSCETIAVHLMSHFETAGIFSAEVWEEETGGAMVEHDSK